MEEAASPSYQVPRSFLPVEGMPPLLAEASDPNKELWLLRLPGGNDLDLAQLSKTSLRMNLQAADGTLGHLVCNGVKYSFQKHHIQSSVKYAYVPTADKIEVRPVSVEVSLVKSLERAIPPPTAAGEADTTVPIPEREIPAAGAVSDQEKSGITRESSKRTKSSSTQKQSLSEGGESSKKKKRKVDSST